MASKLQHMSATPREFTLQYLEHITDSFSKDHIIGRGEHGVVYKGVLDNGEEIALKKLYHMPGLDVTQFMNELNNLARARHQNIIRLIGYCCNIGHKRVKHDDEYTSAVVEERFLCFEYLQGGSLDKYISDESCALDWLTCFKIIKGVCEGLNYLHNGTNDHIFHLDLKPSNILLDKNMMPKIGDFGYSRLFPSEQTYVTTEAIERTWGYKPPEYISKGETTSKFDIFSLGVIIIEVMARFIGYSSHADMPFQELVDLVHLNWKKKLVAMTSCDTSQQVTVCLKMALRCLEDDQMNRPTIAEIVKELNKLNTAESSFTGEAEMEDRGSEWLQAAMELPVSASLGPIGSLFRKLHSFKATNESLPAGVNEGEIHSLKKELEELCISLMDLSEANDTSFTAKYWMKEVREVCYDIENYFDKLIMQPSNVSNVCWIHKLLKRRPHIAIDFSTLVARVADARERRGRLVKWNISNENIEQESEQASITPDIASSSTLFLQPELTLKLLVPADAHMHDLVDLLAFDNQKQKRLKVVSIFGCAGIGKTTVARTLYRKFGGKFDCRAFLRMSRQPDIRRLLTSMLSQIKAPPAHAFADVQVLADNIRTHLEHKRYFVVIDELWTPSVWNTIRRAFPDGNCCSRVITTTENEDAALASCSYQSKFIFKMRSVSGYQSTELLSSGVSGSGRGSRQDFEELSYGVIMTSGGLPLASVNTGSISEPNLVREQWEQIQDSLASTLSANPTCEVMEEVLNLIYNSLPRHLKTCLLYLNVYPEGYTIWKYVLVGQWIGEGFIGLTRKKKGFVGPVKQKDTEEDEVEEKVRVAHGYFVELARRGMIQAVDTNDEGEVLSCTVHHMVLDLIRCKCMEDNFITTVDKFPSSLVLPDMVRRLSVQFGGAKVAKIPESIVLSQVRSLLYFGSFQCAPSTGDYGSLQILNLHIWADQDKTFDLTAISKLYQLKYFKVECNITVNLPTEVRMLQRLGTLEVDAPLYVVPLDIFTLKSLLQLCLPSQVKLPDGIEHMTSLRSLGDFSLSTNSADNVLGLGKLIKLWDLRINCSAVKPGDLVGNMKHFGSILGEFKELKSLIMDSGTSNFSISCDSLSNTPCAPALLERFEFPRTWIFPSLPKWFGDLNKLCILKVAVREISTENIDILKGLHSLTTLSIYVSIAPKARIIFGEEGFTLLRSFKFTSAALCLAFTVGAMQKVEILKLRFDANKSEQHDLLHAGINNLLCLKEISAKIGIVGADETESHAGLLTKIFRTHPSSPIFNVQLVDRTFNENGGYEKEHQTTETQDGCVNTMLFDSQSFVAPSTSSPMQNLGEDEDKVTHPESSLGATFGQESSLETTFSNLPKEGLITSEISEEGFDEQRAIKEKGPLEDDNIHVDNRSSPPPGSISHLQDPGEDEDKATHPMSSLGVTFGPESSLEATVSNLPENRLIKSKISEEGFGEQRGIQEKDPREDDNTQADSRSSLPLGSISHMQYPVPSQATEPCNYLRYSKGYLSSFCPATRSVSHLSSRFKYQLKREQTLQPMAGVLDALASNVTSMLAEMAQEEVAMLIGVSEGIEDLGIKLGDLKSFLADADRRNITDESVRRWVQELKRAMYLATDIIDLCQLKAMEQGQTKEWGCLNPLLFCMRNPLHAHDIGTRIKALNEKLDSICNTGRIFNFLKMEAYQDQKTTWSHATDRKTDSLMEQLGVVGEKIEEDTRALVEVLTREAGGDKIDRLMVVAIIGVGGIGKTTLGKKIFNDEAIKGNFTKQIWLSITQDFSDVELLSKSITAAGGDLPGGGAARDKDLLVGALMNTIKEKKFFLVLDDLWGVDAWKKHLMTPFSYGGRGSRVLITTRDGTVVRRMKAVHCHHVDKLGPEDAWSLLKMQVLTTEENAHDIDVLKDVGMKIVARCDGLPLSIKVMGGLLCNKEKSRRGWEDILHDDIWSVSPMSDDLNYAIYVSYQDLSPYLKQCFLHFSLKPQKVVLQVHEIVSMWICEGLIQGGSNSLEEEGKKNYKDLILRNLIEIDPAFPSQLICNMHDVIRSFAQFMARDETLVAQHGDAAGRTLRSCNFLRLSIETKGVGSDEFEWRYLRQQKFLRTLILTGNLKTEPGDSLINFPSLRLLHVESASIAALVECVHQLKHLRYLTLKRTDVCRLPENIHEMKFLQHICLEGCASFVKLPDGIIKLQGLRFLDIYGTRVNSIPRGFQALTNLRLLSGFPAYIDGDWCSLEELGSLSQLNYLSLESLENVSSALLAAKARVNAKKQLSYLALVCGGRVGDGLVQGEISDSEEQIIEAVFDVLCPQPCIEQIFIEGYFGRRLPGWMTSTAIVPLESLKLLCLEHLPCCTQLPDGLCRLPYLEWLQVYMAPVIKCVGPEFVKQYNQRHRSSSQLAATFPKLQKLSFFVMEEWEEWVWEAEVKAMPLLEELQITSCKLGCMPPGLMSHAMALKKLVIWDVQGLHSLENFVSVVELELRKIAGLAMISNLPKLQKLEISYCRKLKTLKDMDALRRLELRVSRWENQLPVYLQTVKPSHLLLSCNLAVLTSMVEGESSSEWDKFSHIKQVEAYAGDGEDEKKWHVLYTSESGNIQTNIHQDRLVEEED